MAKSVTTIPATLSRFTAAPINSTKKRRVAAYARVSTDNEEQLTSYEAQIDYYTNYIKGRDDWEFVGVYPDEGITGTNAEIQRDRKGNIIYDKETKDTELVKWEESIEDYMAREVLPHIPDAAAFFEENLGAKKPVIKRDRR